jgi:hypothetical protein
MKTRGRGMSLPVRESRWAIGNHPQGGARVICSVALGSETKQKTNIRGVQKKES